MTRVLSSTIDPNQQAHQIAKRLMERFRAPSYQPPRIPQAAQKILAATRQPHRHARELVALLEKDPWLTARVMQQARSPFFAGANPPQSLHTAIVRLGAHNLRLLVMEAFMRLRVFRAPQYHRTMEALQHHSLATAYAARMIAASAGYDGEEAFLCGLMHDVGIAAILLTLADVPRKQKPPPLTEPLWEAIILVHQEAGEWLTRHWKMPMAVQNAAGRHHRPATVGYEECAVINLAESMAFEVSAWLDPKDPYRDCIDVHTLETAREVIGLSAITHKIILRDLATMLCP